MKQPRIDAFDPKVAKKLASPLTGMPTIEERKEPPTEERTVIKKESSLELKKERTKELFTSQVAEREKIHHTFDIFLDQLLSLKELMVGRQRAFGKPVKQSELVREALDLFITKEKNPK